MKMDKYTIPCTEEQTKKAFELGAELELLDTKEEYIQRTISNKSFEENYNTPYAKVIDKGAYIIPTAEQMIGWLRSKGFRFKIEELSDTIVAYRATFGYWYKCGQSNNPKGATFAVIDAALDYLAKKRNHPITEKLPNEYVDLGLPSGTLWAKCNIGAEKETDYGDYFMWGSTKPNTDTPCDWMHAPFNNKRSDFDESYFNAYKSEWLTEEGILKPEHDAAHIIMGGNWRIPTKSDFDEMLNGTISEWVTNYQGSGVNGRLFTSKTNGNTIFIPAADFRYNRSTFVCRGVYGYVWSSMLYTDSDLAQSLYFSSGTCRMNLNLRFFSCSIRGVMNLKKN